MGFGKSNLRFLINFLFLHHFLLLLVPSVALNLNRDGVLLLSFKYSILSDPLSLLQSWNYDDATPCSWSGVTCTQIGNPGSPDMFRVTSLVLPNSQLLGSIPEDLGRIEHLRRLDLSNNFFNGSLPSSIFNSTELQVLSLSSNRISGELPESVGGMTSLRFLNLSDNAFSGVLPENLTVLQNLTVVSLRGNYFSGRVPSGVSSVEVLDLSSNLLNGSLPSSFGGDKLRYLNLSNNKMSGTISLEFAKHFPQNVTVDLSFNNLTGPIPESLALLNQKTEAFSGNADLCGKPLKNLCPIPSTLSSPPNVSEAISPAIAVIPKPLDSTPGTTSPESASGAVQNQTKSGIKPGTIAAITVANLAGIAIVGMIALYIYQLKKDKNQKQAIPAATNPEKKPDFMSPKVQVLELRATPASPTLCSCINLKLEEASDTTSSGSEEEEENPPANVKAQEGYKKGGKLVTVDGETQLELETLYKASAYILGTSGTSIVYKAVLANGTAFAVRRIGESCLARLKDFESQLRNIAKLKHPNLVKVIGFYWGNDEKLVIYDYVSNGSLASFHSRKPGSSPFHLSFEVRLRIARGVARGLAFIHEKKHVHGNLKPSNILLDPNMDPIIIDLGLDRLVSANITFRTTDSARFLGAQPSTTSRDRPPDLPPISSPYLAPGPSTGQASPYHPPESLKHLKPNHKWDVYSFGIVLLELLTGRVLSDQEVRQWAVAGSVGEERIRALRLVDVAIRADLEIREEAMLDCFRIGFACASFAPQKRPSMKEAVQVLEKIPRVSSDR